MRIRSTIVLAVLPQRDDIGTGVEATKRTRIQTHDTGIMKLYQLEMDRGVIVHEYLTGLSHSPHSSLYCLL